MARANAVPVTSDDVRLSAFQSRVLTVPEAFDLFLGGGRGGGKSYSLALLALRHVEQYRARARVLYLRQSHQGCADFEAIALDLYTRAYGKSLKFNAQEGVFRFPSGGTLEVNQLADPTDYAKYQGRSFTLLLADECGQYPTPDLLDRMRSNLRGPEGLPLRTVLAANPGDAGHHWLAKRYVFRAAPWHPFVDEASGREFVYAPSTYTDNDHVDRAAYERQLRAACPSDPELLRAWLAGDWAVARGAYFASVLDETRNGVDPWPSVPTYWSETWRTFVALDFGSAAPSVCLLIAESPGGEAFGRFYPRGSLVVFDELATHEQGSLTRGLGWTVVRLAEEIRETCARWKMRPEGVADDACFAAHGHSRGSIADELRAAGVFVDPAKKADRITGWTRLRQLLAAGGSPDQPGVYIARHCAYLWATLPYLARDQRKVEDLDSRGPDHGADALRYGVLLNERFAVQEDMY